MTDSPVAYEQFVDELEAARKPKGSDKHPLSVEWMNGRLSRKQLGFWAVQHFYYIDAVPPQFAALYARMPDIEGRLMLLDNLLGEDMPDQPEKSHPNLLLQFAETCGVKKEEVISAEQDGAILATTRAMRAWIWELATIRPLEQACAGIMVALEGQLPTLYPSYIEAMRKMGFTDEQLEFFHVHVENDVEHAEVGLRLCHKFADTRQKQLLAIETVKASAALRFSMLDGVLQALKGVDEAA